MGLSVISTLPGTAAAAPSLPGSTALEGLPGDFAALLSGELKALLTAAQTDAAKTGIAPEDIQTTADSASSNPTIGIVDPALIASLMGHSGMQPAIARPATPRLEVPNEHAAEGIARATQAIADSRGRQADAVLDTGTASGKATPGGAESEKPAPDGKFAMAAEKAARTAGNAATAAASEKTASAGLPAMANGIAQRNEAANIAVEANTAATTPAASTLMNVAAAAQHAAPEASGLGKQTSTTIDAHLQAPSWPQQFGEKVVWLARNDQQTAQININPPQLGPVQITVSLNGDQATLAFASPHAEVRQAIESAMPQLKEMLSTAGISLGQSNVGANMGQNNPDNPFQSANGTRSANENAILPANDKAAGTGSTPALQRGRGLVDLFA